MGRTLYGYFDKTCALRSGASRYRLRDSWEYTCVTRVSSEKGALDRNEIYVGIVDQWIDKIPQETAFMGAPEYKSEILDGIIRIYVSLTEGQQRMKGTYNYLEHRRTFCP